MNVLKAIRWGLQSWEFDISGRTIQNCFKKALDSQSFYAEPVDSTVMDEIQNSFSLLKISTPIQDVMDINTFLNPVEEIIQDTPEDIDSQILAQYGPELEDDIQEEEELEVLPKISLDEAIAALQKLHLYEEQQEKGSSAFIHELDKHQNVLWGRKLALQSQRDIQSYFPS